jgi:hypothetical protein
MGNPIPLQAVSTCHAARASSAYERGVTVDRRLRASAWRTVVLWLGVLAALALAVWGVTYAAGIIVPIARQLNDRQQHEG